MRSIGMLKPSMLKFSMFKPLLVSISLYACVAALPSLHGGHRHNSAPVPTDSHMPCTE